MTTRKLAKPIYGLPEQWKQYKDTRYYVSDQGRVKEHMNNGKEYIIYSHIWSNELTGNSACERVRLNIDGTRKWFTVSRLVWETFRYPLRNDQVLVHKNGMSRDNCLYNLKVSDRNSNCKAAGTLGGKSQKRCIIDLDHNLLFNNFEEAGKYLHVSPEVIRKVCYGTRGSKLVNVAWYDVVHKVPYKGKWRTN